MRLVKKVSFEKNCGVAKAVVSVLLLTRARVLRIGSALSYTIQNLKPICHLTIVRSDKGSLCIGVISGKFVAKPPDLSSVL